MKTIVFPKTWKDSVTPEQDRENWRNLCYNNLIQMCKFHKQHCDDEHCGVSLHFARMLLEKYAGMEIDKEDIGVFF